MITTLAHYGIALNGILMAVHCLLMVTRGDYPTDKGYLALAGHLAVICVMLILINYAKGN